MIDTNVGHIRLNQLVETSDEPHGDRSQAGWTSACSWQQRSGEGWVEASKKSGFKPNKIGFYMDLYLIYVSKVELQL